MTYERMTCEQDADIPVLLSAYRHPGVARFIHLDEQHYWHYVTASENVFFYKVREEEQLVAAVHCELAGQTLYMDILVFPQFQHCGIGTRVLQDIVRGLVTPGFSQIEVSIDEANTPSIRLFEKLGFRCVSKEDELLNYVYHQSANP